MSKLRVSITIPLDQWEETGPEHDPKARLLAMLEVNGSLLHLEAYSVRETRYGVQLYPEFEDTWAVRAIRESAEHEKVHRTKIAGRMYVLIATPYAV